MASSKMSREDAEKALSALVPALAKALGGKVVKSPDKETMHYGEIETSEGYNLGLWAGYSAGYGKVEIRAHLPKDPRNNQTPYLWNEQTRNRVSDPVISCTVTREAKAIASEVFRRLLPEYRPWHAKALESIAQSHTYQDTTKSRAEEIAKVVGVAAVEIKEGKFSLYRSEVLPESLGEVSVFEGRVDLRLSDLTVDEAKAIFALLAKSRAGEAGEPARLTP